VRPGGRVRVREYRNGSPHLFAGRRELRWRELAERATLTAAARPRRRWKPAADHPRRGAWQWVFRLQEAVEMTGGGKRGKPQGGFPLFPSPLTNAGAFPIFPPPGELALCEPHKNPGEGHS